MDEHIMLSEIPPTSSRASFLARVRRFSSLSSLEQMLAQFSPSERLFLYVFTFLLALATFFLVVFVSDSVSVSVPTHGGTLTEGEVGSVRFINPVLALSQPDQDLTELVYSGLMRSQPDGSLIPDLASSYTISPDGTTYTFVLRPNARFQDNTPVTAEDVVYTITTIQNPNLKSPHRGDWLGVRVSAPDSHTVVFTLSSAYAPFLANTTLGIMPKALWSSIPDEEFAFSQFNTKPIGSGPFKVTTLTKDASGTIHKLDLTAFDGEILGKPYLDGISFIMFTDDASAQSALASGQIASLIGFPTKKVAAHSDQIITPLPRVFGVFFNQNHNDELADAGVRKALNAAIDPSTLVRSILGNRGIALTGVIPPSTSDTPTSAIRLPLALTDSTQAPLATTDELVQKAQTMLAADGWVKGTGTTTGWTKNKKALSFTIATADTPELVTTAHAVAAAWNKVGAHVSVAIYPVSELQTTIIQPRAYDAILFGEAVGPELDLYAFWNSKERNYPGLNLSMYTNTQVDGLLAQARSTSNMAARNELYEKAAGIIQGDVPAVFLYSPQFSYIIPQSLQGVTLGSLTSPSDRFQDVYNWYMQTERVWNVFAPYVR
ncbi:MAG: family 5 extracellular solute-binding protein peptide/nickel transport system substrate-binding [Candidatus Kaiserbacteria bacterium]|nr:family 5 extracellular solute-binding protein peptide/nickel transport system substrate-binding [Candidatus Kaiserbacteria bacterium]